jgi:hypothetical protein
MKAAQMRALLAPRLPRELVEIQAAQAAASVPQARGVVLTLPTATADAFLATMNAIETGGREFDGYFQAGHIARLRVTKPKGTPKKQRPLCGARTRDGRPCCARVVEKTNGQLARRCRMHGGMSTGPRTVEGRAAIVESNRRCAAGRAQAAST